MTRVLIAVTVLAAGSLACQQAAGIATFTPTASPTAPAASPSSTPRPSPSPTAEDVQTATVRAALVNIRSTPDGEVIGQIEAGTRVVIVETSGDWVHIAEPDGWIWSGCLQGSEKGCSAK